MDNFSSEVSLPQSSEIWETKDMALATSECVHAAVLQYSATNTQGREEQGPCLTHQELNPTNSSLFYAKGIILLIS